jgi:hypothetical protein
VQIVGSAIPSSQQTPQTGMKMIVSQTSISLMTFTISPIFVIAWEPTSILFV